MERNKIKTEILLQGRTGNSHCIIGNFFMNEEQVFEYKTGSIYNVRDGHCVTLNVKDAVIRHQNASGNMAEHKTLQVESGRWFVGEQVEYNPVTRMLNNVWD